MHRRRWFVLALVATLILGACGDDSDDTTAGGEDGAQTLTVAVDADPDATGGISFTSYFPRSLTAHPGDTVDFEEYFTGEPHTVTLGTLVTKGLASADPEADEEPAELQKIPSLLPDGPGDAIQAAAQPCFITVDPPESDACSKDQQKQPVFDGSHTYYNSGFLGQGDHFKVQLADDLAPGTYSYFCALHRGGMSGEIKVVAKSAKADSPADVKATAKKELDTEVAKLKDVMAAIKAGTLPPFIPTAAPGSVIAGGGSEDVQSAVPVIFGPDTVSIKAGGSVTWTIVGPHSVTFGGTEAERTLIVKSPDGGVHLNEKAAGPVGGAGQPQGPPPEENAEPGPPTIIDGGSYAGSGLHSSGLVLSFPPQLFAYKLSFTKAGSYPYFCVVHPDMKGVVNVT